MAMRLNYRTPHIIIWCISIIWYELVVFLTSKVVHLHDHNNQEFHSSFEVSDPKFTWLYKIGKMEDKVEQIHVDMMKFNMHIRESVSQLCRILHLSYLIPSSIH
jgi:hypothetical protein